MKVYQFHIDNMHCGGCARKIQALFAEEPGVSVATDVDSKSLTLTLSDEATLDETQARDRLKQADYPATAASHWHHFKVADMNCGHCEATIRKALADADDVTVDLSTKQVSVLSQQDDASLLGLITNAGFTPEPWTETAATWHEFKVPDMTCGHCEATIHKALADADEIKVDLPIKKVAVLSSLDGGQLLASIQAAGYSPELWSETEDNSHPKSEGASVAAAAPQPEDKAITKTETTTPDAPVASNAATADGVLMFVPDMSCASCVVKIEKAFANAGVEARVNLADKQVSAAHGVLVADAQHILASAGYRGEVVTDAANAMADKAAHDAKEYRTRIIQSMLTLGVGIPLMLWGMAGGDMTVHSDSSRWGWGLVSLLCLLLLISCGGHFYQGMWRALKAKSANMDTLIALGTGCAWLYSSAVVLFPSWFPDGTRHVYFEASVMIIGLINLGHALELRARGKTSEAVQKLLGLQANTALLVTENGDKAMPISDLKPGDILRLRPGDRVALDGEVVNGESLLDESMLTGEPMPVKKTQGSVVSAGTINGDGSLTYRVMVGPKDTRLAKIIALVQEAQTSKMPIGRLTDKIAGVFVPVVVVIAVLAALIWYLVGPAPQLSHALVVLTSVLIIACPCALGLATPMSIMVAVGRAAQMGVLIRNGEALQVASNVSCVVLDKTGTVTEGKPQLVAIHAIEDAELDEAELIQAVASLEQQSGHPLAQAFLAAAKVRDTAVVEPQQFAYRQGQGIVGTINQQQWLVGNSKLLDAFDVAISPTAQSQLDDAASLGQTPVLAAKNGKLLAILAISDPLRADAKTALAALRQQGKKLVLLSGDNQHTADAVAKQLGIDQVIAGVLPDEKQAWVKKLQQQGEVVAMVGDGINDAPALAAADVGVALGSGTEVAIESADLTLLNPRLENLAQAFALSKATLGNIKQNLFGAFLYNSCGIPIAAGVLYPLFGVLLSPVIAGAAMALSSLTVVTNANRLRHQKLQ
ncbi:Cu+-exporting ATPase [Shewanella fodinae]|uniref:Copper-exporting P-type ATPase n=2 Tax=Shewanella fodinae TaxID=552357 RepID=A0A4R2F527_9GAMM|nr:Cu+-exporting ATPase [Shewanella fodinae]